MKLESLKTFRKIISLMCDKSTKIRVFVIVGVIIEMVNQILTVGGPVFLKNGIDELSSAVVDLKNAEGWIVIFVLSWTCSAIASIFVLAFTGRICGELVTNVIRLTIRNEVPKLAFSEDSRSGQVHGMLERLPFSLDLVVEGLMWRVLPVVIQVVASALVIAHLMPLKYSVVLLLILTAFVIFSYYSAKEHELSARDMNSVSDDLSANLADILINSQKIFFSGSVDNEVDYLRKYADAKTRAAWRRSWLLNRAAMVQYGIISFGLVALFAICAGDVFSAKISIGDFVMLETYAFQFAIPLGAFGFIFRQAGTALENVKECLANTATKTPPCITHEDTAELPNDFIEFENVTVQIDSKPIIENICLRLKVGSLVAIVGHNGSGKSTLAKTLAGLHKPIKGRVLLGGMDIHRTDPSSRHKHVVYIPQHSNLFSRTLRENVTYFPSTLDDTAARDLLERLAFHQDGSLIDFDSYVGEGGSKLSGGQMQKIEISRAMGIDVPTIVFDESTSSLDNSSELTATHMFREFHGSRRTVVFITHKAQNVSLSDHVIFLHQGVLAASGTHHHLLDENALYRQFWETHGA